MSQEESKQPSYDEMRYAQHFFGQSIELCMKGNLSELKALATDFVKSNSEYKIPDIFQTFQSEGKTFLHIACSSGHMEIFEFIFEKCKNYSLLNAKDINGFTPLMNATISESDNIIKSLLEHKADVNIQNNDGASAIHFASSDGSVSRINMLIDHGANINIMSQSGSALHWAAGKGCVEALKVLLSHGCDVDALSPSGLPAIFLAAVSHSDECVRMLVEANANSGFIVSGNLTVLHVCAEHGLTHAVAAIVATSTGQKCCKVLTVDGNAPIHLAAMGSHIEIMKALLPYSTNVLDANQDTSIDALLAEGRRRLEQWNKKYGHTQDSSSVSSNSNSQIASTNTTTTSNTNSRNDNYSTTESNSYSIDEISELFESLAPVKSKQDESKAEEEKTKGNIAFKEKKYNDAIQFYSTAIQYNNMNATLWSNRSSAYLALNQNNLALRDAEICRRVDPTWPKGCYRLAAARLALGQYEDAAVAAFEGVKLDGSSNEMKELLQKAVKLGREEHEEKQQMETENANKKPNHLIRSINDDDK